MLQVGSMIFLEQIFAFDEGIANVGGVNVGMSRVGHVIYFLSCITSMHCRCRSGPLHHGLHEASLVIYLQVPTHIYVPNISEMFIVSTIK